MGKINIFFGIKLIKKQGTNLANVEKNRQPKYGNVKPKLAQLKLAQLSWSIKIGLIKIGAIKVDSIKVGSIKLVN